MLSSKKKKYRLDSKCYLKDKVQQTFSVKGPHDQCFRLFAGPVFYAGTLLYCRESHRQYVNQ